MQRLTWDFAGEFDVHSVELAPYAGGYIERIVGELTEGAESSLRNENWSDADQEWVDSIAKTARAAGAGRPNTFIHGDYTLNNLTVMQDQSGRWRVSGIFDLHEAPVRRRRAGSRPPGVRLPGQRTGN